jgi:hypothetical protein
LTVVLAADQVAASVVQVVAARAVAAADQAAAVTLAAADFNTTLNIQHKKTHLIYQVGFYII